MNIFVLDNNPVKSAQMMCDKHVVKMIVESAQMLSTVHRYIDGYEYKDRGKRGQLIRRWEHYTDRNNVIRLHKAVMINHPCTIWARQTAGNYAWLASHAIALCNEYEHRYKRKHANRGLIEWMSTHYPIEGVVGLHLTPFAQAMPDQYKVEGDAVHAYRNYYIGEKSGFAKWTNREIPEWFTLTQCA
jgi:hypothetical protein